MEVFLATIICLASFIVLVLVHELGHFLMAKGLKIRVLRFSIGFGKPLLKFHDQQKTEYVLAPIPLGGYVKLLDENEGKVAKKDLPYAFNRQSPIKRILVIVAGPLSNLLLAFIALWLMFMVGVQGIKPIIGQVQPKSIAAKMGLKPNQQIISIDHRPTDTWQAVKIQLLSRIGEAGPLVIQTQNAKRRQFNYMTLLSSDSLREENLNVFRQLGIQGKRPKIPPMIVRVEPNSVAAKANIQPGDKILFANGKKIQNFFDLTDLLENNPNEPVKLILLRKNKQLSLWVTPKLTMTLEGDRVGRIGVYSEDVVWPEEWIYMQKYSPLAAIKPAAYQGWWLIQVTVNILTKIVTGDISWRYIGGPISIIQGFSASVSQGIGYFLMFLALVNISLGIINLLPIPILDGGYLVYYTVELVFRRPLPLRVQRIGLWLGALFLLGVISLALFNDFTRLW